MNAREAEALRWFRQARADLDVVRSLQSTGHYAAACFYSQQTAEKALKAVLYNRGSRVVLGHSVRELARQCEAYDTKFARILEVATLLDQFYIPTRYPTDCRLLRYPARRIPHPKRRLLSRRLRIYCGWLIPFYGNSIKKENRLDETC